MNIREREKKRKSFSTYLRYGDQHLQSLLPNDINEIFHTIEVNSILIFRSYSLGPLQRMIWNYVVHYLKPGIPNENDANGYFVNTSKTY